MKFLVVGNGAREHILVERLAQGCEVYAYMAARNPGIARLASEYALGDVLNGEEIGRWAVKKGIEYAFVSPDPSLAAGVSDALEDVGVNVCSPLKNAAEIEWNKCFARNMMEEKNIKGLPLFTVAHNKEDVERALRDIGEVVVKPKGLTGGKGVKIFGEHLYTKEDVLSYALDCINKEGEVVLEEKLRGQEFTLQAFSDGSFLSFMPPVQDFKRAYEGDRGENSGGMGSYSTGELLPFLRRADVGAAQHIMEQTIAAMKAEGREFKGVLYGQFMLTLAGVKLIEFNSRFGDPEAMNVLCLLKNNLTEIFLSIYERHLQKATFSDECTVCKYVVPEGYPERKDPPSEISVDEAFIKNVGAKIYYAAVNEQDGRIYTTSSRSIAVLGISKDVEKAEEIAEIATKGISGKVRHRSDIGKKEMLEKKRSFVDQLLRRGL